VVERPRRKLGAPSLYREEYNEAARKMCLLGFTDEQLADVFDVAVQTLKTWKNKYPSFLASIKAGKEQADAKVVKSLYQRAMGYSHPEEKVFCSEGEITTYDTVKHYPPDTTACIFWLKNRQPDHWRDRTEFSGPGGGPIISTPPSVVINFVSARPGDDAKLIEQK